MVALSHYISYTNTKTRQVRCSPGLLTTSEREIFAMADYIVLSGIKVAKDFTPETFGRLTTIGPRFYLPAPPGKRAKYIPHNVCECLCGSVRVYQSSRLVAGNNKSCGCLYADSRKTCAATHGKSKSPEYLNWRAMLQRCYDQSQKHYSNYGGRGIRVCDRWQGKDGFQVFLADMGQRPIGQKYIDRLDNDGPYSPENCRWASNKEQCNNKRNCRYFTIDGVTKTMTQWAEANGLCRHCVKKRIAKGWSIEKAISTPVKAK